LVGSMLSCETAVKDPSDPRIINKYGPMVKDPKGILNLPSGFTYKIIAQEGAIMDDGLTHPGKTTLLR